VSHSWNLRGWQGVDGRGSLEGVTSAAVSDLSPSKASIVSE